MFNGLNKNSQIFVNSLSNFAEDTRKRETEDLQKLPKRVPCRQRLILTYDEEDTITDQHGTIDIIPVWRWLLTE
ncbi:MAG: hypothetical protein IJV34_00265 [Prevotella sp.]|nr:hypothetical protein [Prevotella sp.]